MFIAQCLLITCLPAGVVGAGSHHEINKVLLLAASVLLTLFYWGMVAQMVKNPPAIRETGVPSLGWENPPGEGNGYSLQYSCLENSMDRGAW